MEASLNIIFIFSGSFLITEGMREIWNVKQWCKTLENAMSIQNSWLTVYCCCRRDQLLQWRNNEQQLIYRCECHTDRAWPWGWDWGLGVSLFISRSGLPALPPHPLLLIVTLICNYPPPPAPANLLTCYLKLCPNLIQTHFPVVCLAFPLTSLL